MRGGGDRSKISQLISQAGRLDSREARRGDNQSLVFSPSTAPREILTDQTWCRELGPGVSNCLDVLSDRGSKGQELILDISWFR